MHRKSIIGAALAFGVLFSAAPASPQSASVPPVRFDTLRNPDIQAMVARLELAKYKATIKGLTQFGDRRQGTSRNRAAVDWIEAQLKSYGCTNTERITYTYTTPQRGGTERLGSGRRAVSWGEDAHRCKHRLAQADRSEASRAELRAGGGW
jgi:hypothetical protein